MSSVNRYCRDPVQRGQRSLIMLRELAVNPSDRRIGAPVGALTFLVRPPHEIGKIIFVHGANLLAALPSHTEI